MVEGGLLAKSKIFYPDTYLNSCTTVSVWSQRLKRAQLLMETASFDQATA